MKSYIEDNDMDIKQDEIKLKIGSMDVNLFYSDNVLNIKIEEKQIDMVTLLSLQQKESSIKYIFWDNKEGLISNLSRSI
jgi:hypothetical protein